MKTNSDFLANFKLEEVYDITQRNLIQQFEQIPIQIYWTIKMQHTKTFEMPYLVKAFSINGDIYRPYNFATFNTNNRTFLNNVNQSYEHGFSPCDDLSEYLSEAHGIMQELVKPFRSYRRSTEAIYQYLKDAYAGRSQEVGLEYLRWVISIAQAATFKYRGDVDALLKSLSVGYSQEEPRRDVLAVVEAYEELIPKLEPYVLLYKDLELESLCKLPRVLPSP